MGENPYPTCVVPSLRRILSFSILSEVDPNKRDLVPDEIGEKVFNSRWFCELCNVTATSEATFKTHTDGKRHVKVLNTALVLPGLNKLFHLFFRH